MTPTGNTILITGPSDKLAVAKVMLEKSIDAGGDGQKTRPIGPDKRLGTGQQHVPRGIDLPRQISAAPAVGVDFQHQFAMRFADLTRLSLKTWRR